jgi:hypothetical protein
VELLSDPNREGYLKFLHNCAILSVEEGLIDEDEIVENLKLLFDPNWRWKHKEIEVFRYLVRFLPHKQVVATLISDTTYFKMKKVGVLVSLKAWTGDIDPYDSLEELWVQFNGIPPSGATGKLSNKWHHLLGSCWRWTGTLCSPVSLAWSGLR